MSLLTVNLTVKQENMLMDDIIGWLICTILSLYIALNVVDIFFMGYGNMMIALLMTAAGEGVYAVISKVAKYESRAKRATSIASETS